jgi:hypothetical protein
LIVEVIQILFLSGTLVSLPRKLHKTNFKILLCIFAGEKLEMHKIVYFTLENVAKQFLAKHNRKTK